MEADAEHTNWELFIVAVRSLCTKKAQGGGGGSPATVPWKCVGTGKGDCQKAGVWRGFLEPASPSRMGLRT